MRIPRTGLGLRDVFTEAHGLNPYESIRGKDLSAFESLLHRSPAIDLTRQYLPSWLGGYGRQRMAALDDARSVNPTMRNSSLRVGDYPILDNQHPLKQGAIPDLARRASQAAGVITRDATSQGLLNVYWFLNAAEAVAMAAGQQGMHGALGKQPFGRKAVPGAPTGTPFRSSMDKVSATYPLILGASAATGGLFRQPGYSAVLPSGEDRRESSDPVTERILRSIGRTGRLLPYEQFIEERPDVSRSEYERYKAYLFGDRSAIVKATGDGIHGPEVNILGKSVPLLTGVLPLAGGVLGGRAGVRMAGHRLAGTRSGNPNQFRKQSTLHHGVRELRREIAKQGVDGGDPGALGQQLYDAQRAATAQDRRVEGTLLTGALAGTSVGLGVTAAGAQLLEQVRRAQNAEENRRREQERASRLPEQALPV
jgi:hypothetical protein